VAAPGSCPPHPSLQTTTNAVGARKETPIWWSKAGVRGAKSSHYRRDLRTDNGAFAEYVALPAIDVWKNDPAIPVQCTAIQEPLGNAIESVLAEDVAGKTVLVTGCGPLGLLAIGIARASEATSILATEVRPCRLDRATRMGATQAWQPPAVHSVEAVRAETDGNGVDVLLAMSGNARALQQGREALTQGGASPYSACLTGPYPWT
jgi:threonine dehydrogenase-like Zn-dependent dehydrogenase